MSEKPVSASPEISRTRSIVIYPLRRDLKTSSRSPEANLAEAVGLAEAINLDVIRQDIVAIARPVPATLFGSGQAEHIGKLIREDSITLAIVDHTLSPVQQRNLEKTWNCKVIDRTGIILEIFGERARTREGQLQVELAALTYQKSRLVRSWTHLERQRGTSGAGFLGGPGESQLELDRRMIGARIEKIKGELLDVRRTRGLQRRARERRRQPVVALVGYTNAGKSTLFNTLSGAGVLAQNLLFATLDPTLRLVELPARDGRLNGQRQIMLSDTVGFIADLPTHLIEAFRATLEEVVEADLILHVRDIAHEDSEPQRADVMDVLSTMGISDNDSRLVEVFNKVDLLDADQAQLLRQTLQQRRRHGEAVVAISAVSGEGLDDLRQMIADKLFADRRQESLTVPYPEGEQLAWLYRHGDIIDRVDDENGISVTVDMDESLWGQYAQLYG